MDKALAWATSATPYATHSLTVDSSGSKKA